MTTHQQSVPCFGGRCRLLLLLLRQKRPEAVLVCYPRDYQGRLNGTCLSLQTVSSVIHICRVPSVKVL